MLLEKITEEDLLFAETLCNPIAFAECVFPDFDNLKRFGEGFGHIRRGQVSMLSYEYMVDDQNPNLDKNPRMNAKKNFQMLKGAGTIYNFGSRKYGKTLVTLLLDMLTSIVHLDGWETIFSSYDHVHIRSVLEKLIPAAKNHPFLKIFKLKEKRSPTYSLQWKNGFVINSVNMNVKSKDSGSQFFGHHVKKHWMEEASKETETVREKRIDAVSEMGCIERFSGMTDFTEHSPAGKIFYDLENYNWLCNFPQYISPMWDDKEKENAIKKYGGEDSIPFRIFVKGEVVTEGSSVFDMQRVGRCYDRNRKIKHFEIKKDTFHSFEDKIIISRPISCTYAYVCADIGETAPTEIVIVFLMGETYKYEYNITLHNLTDKQQFRIFKWIAKKLEANSIGIDCGDGTGRSIYRSLEEAFGKNNLFYFDGSKKITVGFAKDDEGEVILKGGQPVPEEEFMSEFSVRHFKDLLYDERMVIPLDYKFDEQVSKIISTQSGNRTIYDCMSPEKHLFDAFKVFSLTHWDTELSNAKPIMTKTFSKTGV